jgi:SAM-dependent methyltransferase
MNGASQMQYAPAAHWDHVFRTLRQASEDLDWGEQWVSAFAPIFHTHHVQRLLDLGCGTGNDVRRLAQRGYTVVGLDYSREAITQAARKAVSRAALLIADMAAPLPFMNGSFEAVMSNVALHMFDDARTRALFTEVRRIVRPQGLFLLHVNALEDHPLRAKRKPPVRELAPNYILEADGQTMHFFSAAYLRELLMGWGEVHLELIEIAARTTGEPFKCVWRGVAHA